TVGTAASTAGCAAALVPRATVPFHGGRQLRDARIGRLRAPAPSAFGDGQQVLPRCQPGCAATSADWQEVQRTTACERKTTAQAREGGGENAAAAKTQRGVVWRRAARYRGGDRNRSLVPSRARPGAGALGLCARPERHTP